MDNKYKCNNCDWSGTIYTALYYTEKQLKEIGQDKTGGIKRLVRNGRHLVWTMDYDYAFCPQCLTRLSTQKYEIIKDHKENTNQHKSFTTWKHFWSAILHRYC